MYYSKKRVVNKGWCHSTTSSLLHIQISSAKSATVSRIYPQSVPNLGGMSRILPRATASPYTMALAPRPCKNSMISTRTSSSPWDASMKGVASRLSIALTSSLNISTRNFTTSR